MGLFQKAKEVAKNAGHTVAEKYRERFSTRPEYAEKRIQQNEVRTKEIESRVVLNKAKAENRQYNPLVRMAKNFAANNSSQGRTVVRGRKRKSKVVEVQPRDPYAHIFGNNKPAGYEHITGNQAKKKDPYAHLFGK